ncbi:hypothetical protein BKA67DRAFT_660281 [Truncatella angustata]|uniref:Uncharacterized protein n=1 Tax=Truncatella angustata TaxID=152316 RepID=A0A9P8UG38_9PEZI|nr:uncharacterized protein BKA67DRAFT_660281 [Truncatella angustata]KAH6651469.1 hypothetical protein BKA67DRAFT_660281 [Truncatella angustata]
MLLATLKNIILSSFTKAKETLVVAEEKALNSLPEPYIPSIEDIAAVPEKLHEKAAKALNGPDANPSQRGDTASPKAEQSDKPVEKGSKPSSSASESKENEHGEGPGKKGAAGGKETLREKAMKKLDGRDANPSQLGDPTSVKAETVNKVPRPEDEGARKKRDSKI